MKIWIVNPFDNLPIEGFRPQRFWMMASAFARAGHKVTLWTGDFSHSNKTKRNFSENEIRMAEKDLGGKIIFIPTPPYHGNISLKRIFSHIKFAYNWLKKANTQQEIPDLIIASSPPLSLGKAVRKYSTKKHIPFVIDIVDAWPETFEQIIPRLFLYPLKKLAQANYKNATAITTVSNRFVEIARKSKTLAPINFFPIGIYPIAKPSLHNRSNTTRLLYLGAIGHSYDLETIIEAVNELPNVILDIAGTGPKEMHLRSIAGNNENIRFHGYLQKDTLVELLLKADIGLIPMFDKSYVGIPCKLADYLSYGLPILNSLHGEVSQMLQEHEAGFTYTARDKKSFIAAQNKLLTMDETKLRQNALRLAEEFNASKIYPKYVEFITSTISEKRTSHDKTS